MQVLSVFVPLHERFIRNQRMIEFNSWNFPTIYTIVSFDDEELFNKLYS